MITILQFLGLVLPVVILLYTYISLAKKCGEGEGNEPVPTTQVVNVFVQIFVFGFTLGTIIVRIISGL